MKKIKVNGKEKEITIHHQDENSLSFTLDSTTYSYKLNSSKNHSCEIALEHEHHNLLFPWHQDRGVIEGWDVIVQEVSPSEANRKKGIVENEHDVRSPMPGKILQVKVKEGDAVEAGQVLAVMEAMKMEHTIKAPRAGTISHIPWNPGDRVEGGVILVELEKKT